MGVKNISLYIKKHNTNFQVLISDLKSARKKALEKIYSQTRIFQKKIQMGRQHCDLHGDLKRSKRFFLQNQLLQWLREAQIYLVWTFWTEFSNFEFWKKLEIWQPKFKKTPKGYNLGPRRLWNYRSITIQWYQKTYLRPFCKVRWIIGIIIPD